MGFQFVHLEGCSRKPDEKGRSVDYVLSEAERRPHSCTHVLAPLAPELVFGLSVAELRALHDKKTAAAVATIAGGRTRKIRQDQLTLLTVVASHPARTAEVRDDPAVAAEVAAWEQCVVKWLRENWGDDLSSVVRHVDEEHAHLHAYILPSDPEMRARRLHPGVAAKEAIKREAVAEGADAKACNAAGDKAYRAAMRAMQDGFWREVGMPCGLARIGPARRRLTRAEWHAERAGVAAAALALRVADGARVEADAVRQAAIAVMRAAESKEVAATALEARAQIAATNARIAVTTARDKALEAKVVANQAIATKKEVEQQTRVLAARGRGMVKQSRAEAQRILGAARQEAEQTRRAARGFGAWFGALMHGLRGMAPAVVARKAAAAAREEERAFAVEQMALLRTASERTQSDLRKAETRLATVSEAAAYLGMQRDRMMRELTRLRAPVPVSTLPEPRPR